MHLIRERLRADRAVRRDPEAARVVDLARAPVSARIISNASSGFLLFALTVSVIPTELSTGLGPPAITAGNGKTPRSKSGGSAARIEVRIHWPPQNIAALPVAKIWIGVRLLDADRALAKRPDFAIISTISAPATCIISALVHELEPRSASRICLSSFVPPSVRVEGEDREVPVLPARIARSARSPCR